MITYSSLISACEKAGRCEMALQLFERMHKEGCTPNVVTYNSLIAACSHGEWPVWGWGLACVCICCPHRVTDVQWVLLWPVLGVIRYLVRPGTVCTCYFSYCNMLALPNCDALLYRSVLHVHTHH